MDTLIVQARNAMAMVIATTAMDFQAAKRLIDNPDEVNTFAQFVAVALAEADRNDDEDAFVSILSGVMSVCAIVATIRSVTRMNEARECIDIAEDIFAAVEVAFALERDSD